MNANKHSMTNSHYAQSTSFRKACQQYLEISQPGLELDKIATRRQASKYRRGTGVVYKTLNNLPM